MAAALGLATYFALVRIAEAKSETAVGGGVVPLDEHRRAELAAFVELRERIVRLGDAALAERLERLRADGEIWVAPRLGPERWAVFVDALSLVRRIYLRREALLDPVAHLYRTPRPDIPRPYQEAHAWIGLAEPCATRSPIVTACTTKARPTTPSWPGTTRCARRHSSSEPEPRSDGPGSGAWSRPC